MLCTTPACHIFEHISPPLLKNRNEILRYNRQIFWKLGMLVKRMRKNGANPKEKWKNSQQPKTRKAHIQHTQNM